MNCRYWVFEEKGKKYINVSGVDFGSKLMLLDENEKFLLCKCGGHKGWCGRGATKYFNPSFILFEKSENNTMKNSFGKNFRYNRETRKEILNLVLKEFKGIKNE